MNSFPGITALIVLAALPVGFLSPALQADDRPNPAETTLPRTTHLQLDEPLDVAMVRGISLFAERELERVRQARNAPWLKHPAHSESGRSDRQAAREQFKKIIGMPSPLESHPVLARTGSESSATRTAPWGEFANSIVTTCQWDAFEGVTGRGLIAVPKSLGKTARSLSLIVLIPDAGQSPEALFGLEPGLPESQQIGRLCAESGYVVFSPLLIDRDYQWSGHPKVRWMNLPHREFIYRLSFELGLHPVGYDVAKVLTGIQAVKQEFNGTPLETIVVGTGEGGLIALASGAVTDQEIDGVIVRGYFNERERVWEEPIYRNLYGQLLQFGDAELASLIAPRPLWIENCPVVTIDGPAKPEGRFHVAAPGRIETPRPESVQREFNKAAGYYRQANSDAIVLLPLNQSEEESSAALLRILKVGNPPANSTAQTPPVMVPLTEEFKKQRMKSQVEELVRYSQRVLNQSQKVRQELWKDVKGANPQEYAASIEKYRELIHDTFIGKLPEASLPPNPRSRKVLDEETFTGYEVVLDVHPPAPSSGTATEPDWGIVAGGILLLPRDLKPGEKRPVVVFQHGLEGQPMDSIITDPQHPKYKAYKGASTDLVKRGFVVYVIQSPFRGFDNFRVIQRKSNPIGRSLFSYIIEQQRQTLKWLAELSYVDADRIAFYGISYGGKTAVRVPPMLPPGKDQHGVNRPGYCLSICSADFNDWIRKNAKADEIYSYVFHGEYEIFEWNMGHIANYAELSWLMIPRPFMVERGLDDGVAPDEWVAYEYARTLRPYMKLGIDDQVEMEIFDGPHAINGQGTYRFLHRHLNWPEPSGN